MCGASSPVKSSKVKVVLFLKPEVENQELTIPSSSSLESSAPDMSISDLK